MAQANWETIAADDSGGRRLIAGLTALGLLILFVALIQFTPRLLQLVPAGLVDGITRRRIGVISYALAMLLAAECARRILKLGPWTEIGFSRRPAVSDIGWGIVGAALVLAATTLGIFVWKVAMLARDPSFLQEAPNSVGWLSAFRLSGWRDVAWFSGLLALTLLAEEAFFRGAYQDAMRKVGGPTFGIAMATFAFLATQEYPAIVEFGFDIPLGIVAISLGVVHGWLRYRRGDLYAPFVSHVLTFVTFTVIF